MIRLHIYILSKSLVFIFLLISSFAQAQKYEFTSFSNWKETKKSNIQVSEQEELKATVTVTEKIVYIDRPSGQERFLIILVQDEIAHVVDSLGRKLELYFVEDEDELTFYIYNRKEKTFVIMHQ